MKFSIKKFNEISIEKTYKFFEELELLHSSELPNIFKRPDNLEHIKEYIDNGLNNPNQIFFAAEIDGEPIGLIETIIIKDGINPVHVDREYAIIDKLIVKDEYRGFGVATSLIDTTENYLKERGIKEVEIYVWDFNKNAFNLYQSKGFSTLCRRMIKKI